MNMLQYFMHQTMFLTNTNGGTYSGDADISIQDGNTAELPEAPDILRTGYTFTGWKITDVSAENGCG